MEKQEWSVRDIDPNNEILLHGGKWSEEAKRRVSEARRAGRSVMDMFGDLYKKSEKTVSSAAKTASNMVRPTAKAVSKTASNLIRVAKKTVYPTTSKTTTGTLGKKSGDKAMASAGYKKRKIDKKLVARIQDKLDRRYGQGKYKKSESQKLDEKRGKAMDKREKRNRKAGKSEKDKMRKIDNARGKAMDKREKRNKTRKKAEESVAKIKRNETRRDIKAKQKSEKNRSRDAIGENTREKFRNGDMKSGNDALIRKYKGKMKDHMSKSPDERRKNSKQYNEWNQRVKDLEAENKRIGSRNKGSKLEENNTRKMENMYESGKNASDSVRRRNSARTRDLENENESYYKRKKRKNNIQQSATFDYQAAISTVSKKKNQNELSHSGVLGMKWGFRKKSSVSPQQKQFSKKMNKLSKKRERADYKIMRRFEKDKDFRSQAEKSGYYNISKTSPDRTYEFYKIVATNKGNLAGRYYKMDTKMNAKYLKRKHNIIRGIK
nr:MAG TPA: MAEBL protein [Caudoviricetes sp.]